MDDLDKAYQELVLSKSSIKVRKRPSFHKKEPSKNNQQLPATDDNEKSQKISLSLPNHTLDNQITQTVTETENSMDQLEFQQVQLKKRNFSQQKTEIVPEALRQLGNLKKSEPKIAPKVENQNIEKVTLKKATNSTEKLKSEEITHEFQNFSLKKTNRPTTPEQPLPNLTRRRSISEHDVPLEVEAPVRRARPRKNPQRKQRQVVSLHEDIENDQAATKIPEIILPKTIHVQKSDVSYLKRRSQSMKANRHNELHAASLQGITQKIDFKAELKGLRENKFKKKDPDFPQYYHPMLLEVYYACDNRPNVRVVEPNYASIVESSSFL